MSSSTTHPLAGAWLRDLELLLHGIEPGERAEVLAGVHEHLDGSLPPGATDDDVRRVLADLGSPQTVADEAYAGHPVRLQTELRPLTAGRWVPIVIVALQIASLLSILVVAGGIGGYTQGFTDENGVPTQTISYSYTFPGAAVGSLLANILFWLPAAALGMISPLLTGRWALANAALPFAAAVAITLLPDLGWLLSHSELGLNIGGVVGLLTVILGGAAFLKSMASAALTTAQRWGAA